MLSLFVCILRYHRLTRVIFSKTLGANIGGKDWKKKRAGGGGEGGGKKV